MESRCFDDAWSESAISELFALDGVIAAAECDGDGVCGVLIARCAADECELYRIAVLPERRGGGCGKSLMSYLLEECSLRGIKRIFLEVRRSNIPAISLYERFGFVQTAIRKNYYRSPCEDAVIYERQMCEKAEL